MEKKMGNEMEAGITLDQDKVSENGGTCLGGSITSTRVC